MDETRELYTLKAGSMSLKEYLVVSNNKHRFQVSNHDEILYEGESFQQAKSLYDQLSQS
jgi:hypothetical protein